MNRLSSQADVGFCYSYNITNLVKTASFIDQALKRH